jgi:hypothetical protein
MLGDLLQVALQPAPRTTCKSISSTRKEQLTYPAVFIAAAANQDRMPALPYLEDNSGGLSNSTYFNFVR